jgi:hypothetical protein
MKNNMERYNPIIYQKRRTCKLAWMIILVSLFVFIPIKTNNKVKMIVVHKGHGSWIEDKHDRYIGGKHKLKMVRVSYLY